MNSLSLSEDTKAILLLCGHVGGEEGPKPLALSMYNRLALWLKDHGHRPRGLVEGPALEELTQEAPEGLDLVRITQLLERGAAVAFAIERWMNKGVWILCRSDAGYPQRLRNHLGVHAPPILYGFGEQQLLEAGGLAVVGSRNVDDEGGEFAAEVSRRAARQGMGVISGAARGVDQIAMHTALEEGGVVVGVLADSLLRTALQSEVREAIRAKKLVLVSSFHPEAGFHVGSAMERNKYIYGLSDFALVVSAEYETGGTWSGAVEELKRDPHIPVFVRMEGRVPRGNEELVKKGAIPFPEKPWLMPFSDLLVDALAKAEAGAEKITQGDLFGGTRVAEAVPTQSVRIGAQEEASRDRAQPVTVFEAILPVLLSALGQPQKADDLAEMLDVQKSQLDKWLKRAIEVGVVKKTTRPVRFVSIASAGTDLLYRIG